VNLTGLRALIKSRPTGRAAISALSRASEREVIVVTAARITVILASPNVIELLVDAVAGVAFAPNATLLVPEVKAAPAPNPTKVLQEEVPTQPVPYPA
jgi:hypothetical protein